MRNDVSIYIRYRFRNAADLQASGDLETLAQEWNKAFGGTPYEPWGWQAPAACGGGFTYEGATKLPNDMNQAWGVIQIASDLLSRLRNATGGSDWKVVVDEHELPWDENNREFIPD